MREVLDRRTVTSLLLSTILFGGVALFGKLIPLSTPLICLGRALFAAAALAIVLAIRREPLFTLHRPSDALRLLLPGLFLAGNWFFYFLAIKTSTVAIAVISLFTYPFITALIEPLMFKERFRPVMLVGALVVLAGIALIVGRFDFSVSIGKGLLFGTLSGLCFALSGLTSRRLVATYSATSVMWYQFLTIALLFSPVLIMQRPALTPALVGQFVILGSLLTAFAQVLYIASLRNVTASLAAIFCSLQPFVAILLAALVIHEIPSLRTILGGAVVSVAIAGTALWQSKGGRFKTALHPKRQRFARS